MIILTFLFQILSRNEMLLYKISISIDDRKTIMIIRYS